MNKPDSAAAEPRRVVTKVVLTYVVGGREDTLTLSTGPGGAEVDGVVWNRRLMERLSYVDEPSKPVPQRPVRPEDGWKRGGSRKAAGSGTESTRSATTHNGDEEDCIWLHDQGCLWLSLCD